MVSARNSSRTESWAAEPYGERYLLGLSKRSEWEGAKVVLPLARVSRDVTLRSLGEVITILVEPVKTNRALCLRRNYRRKQEERKSPCIFDQSCFTIALIYAFISLFPAKRTFRRPRLEHTAQLGGRGAHTVGEKNKTPLHRKRYCQVRQDSRQTSRRRM